MASGRLFIAIHALCVSTWNNFFKNISRRLTCRKKLREAKMQLSLESGNVRSPLSDSGEHVLAGFLPDLGHFGQIQSDPSRSSRNSAILAGIRPFPPNPIRSNRITAILAGSGKIQSDAAGFWPWPDSSQFLSESGSTAFGDGCRMSPNSGASNIPVAGCCRIPTLPEFRRPTIAEFRQSDIKCSCMEKEFNFGKRFTVFKTVNHFSKIKKTFTVKLKIIFVDHYFCPYQTP